MARPVGARGRWRRSPPTWRPCSTCRSTISAVLGTRHACRCAQLLKLGAGCVLELDRRVGEAIDIYVNNRLVARGEVVVVDERLGVTMTEIIKDGDASA